jgi:hypothetical protein
VGVFLGGVSDDFAMQIIQRGKEGDCCARRRENPVNSPV